MNEDVLYRYENYRNVKIYIEVDDHKSYATGVYNGTVLYNMEGYCPELLFNRLTDLIDSDIEEGNL